MAMQSISLRLQKMKLSQTLAMSEKVRTLKTLGYDIINLSIGEPDFLPPTKILNAAKIAIDNKHHYYTPVSGYLELREAVCEKFLRDNRLHYEPNQIVISTGCKQAIANIFLSLLNPTDEVIIPSPYWISYYELTNLCEAKPVILPTSFLTNFKISAQQLESSITSKTKIFIFSSPCNPTGSVYTHDELKKLVNVFIKHPKIIIISDEIYEYINYTNINYTSIAEFEEVYEQTVTINGLSKAFSIPGWRIGYMGAPLWLAKCCAKIQGQITSGTNSIAQQAAISALKTSPQEIFYMTKALKKRRDIIINFIKQIPNIKYNLPQGAFYIFTNISEFFGKKINGMKINNSDDFVFYLLDKAHVATVSGNPFGDKNSIRISYAISEKKLETALLRIIETLSRVNDRN